MEILRDYAMQFVGIPYLWGGSNAMEGFDCSGFVQELLASVGEDPPGDQTAQNLFDVYSISGKWNELNCGALAFYGKSAKEISHVAMLIDPFRIVEAGGGGSDTTSLSNAMAQSACVRVRLLKQRKDLIAVIKPRYSKIGLI